MTNRRTQSATTHPTGLYRDSLTPAQLTYWDVALAVDAVRDDPTLLTMGERKVLEAREQAAVNALVAEHGMDAALDYIGEAARRIAGTDR